MQCQTDESGGTGGWARVITFDFASAANLDLLISRLDICSSSSLASVYIFSLVPTAVERALYHAGREEDHTYRNRRFEPLQAEAMCTGVQKSAWHKLCRVSRG
jgi:hypothetical protein